MSRRSCASCCHFQSVGGGLRECVSAVSFRNADGAARAPQADDWCPHHATEAEDLVDTTLVMEAVETMGPCGARAAVHALIAGRRVVEALWQSSALAIKGRAH